VAVVKVVVAVVAVVAAVSNRRTAANANFICYYTSGRAFCPTFLFLKTG
jgi:hypothetical protein